MTKKNTGVGPAAAKRGAPGGRDAIPYLKIALPSSLSTKCGESVYNLVKEKFRTQKVRLLLDASEIRRIDPEGLRWLYEVAAMMKENDLPKVVIRRPNRIIRDALILSNTLKYFDIFDEADGRTKE